MNLPSGLKLLDEKEGKGRTAIKSDRVIYNLKIFLNKGEEMRLNEVQARELPEDMIRWEDNRPLIDHTIRLGSRQSMAAVEYTLLGMKAGGYRKVRTSPHLAYREKGIPNLIPENAVLILDIWLRDIVK